MMRRIVEILHDGDGPASVDAAADEAKVCGAEGRELPGEGVEGGGSCAQSFYPAPTSPAPTLTPARARLPAGFVSPPPVLPAPPVVSPAARPRAETSPPPRPSAPPPAPSPAVEKALPVGSRPSYAFLWSTPLDVDGLASLDEEGAWMDAMDAFDVAAGRGPAPSGGASLPCALGRAPTPVLTTPPCVSPRPPAGYGMDFPELYVVWSGDLRSRLLDVLRDRDRAGMAAEDTAPRRVPGSAYLHYPGVDTQDCDDDDDFDVDAYYYHDGDPADDLDLHPTCSSAAFRWTTPSDSAPLGAPRGL